MDNERPRHPLLTPMLPIPTAIQPQGRLQLPVSCLLCDIYGTLFMSASGEWSATDKPSVNLKVLQNLLDEYELSLAPGSLLDQFHKTIQQYHAKLIATGNPHPEVRIEDVWQACLPFQDMAQIKRFAMEYEALTNPVWPSPHLTELLAHCRQQGIILGVISNAQFYTPLLFQWALNMDMNQLGFKSDLIIFSYQHLIAKPDQLLFIKACETLQHYEIAPQQAAYIGNDVRNDLLPAHRAGLQTVLFAGDKRSLRLRKEDPQCAVYNPDVIITGLNQLIPQLNAP